MGLFSKKKVVKKKVNKKAKSVKKSSKPIKKSKKVISESSAIPKSKGILKKSEIVEKKDFLKTGIEGFDKLFIHGIPTGKAILIEGSPGTGKTIFCLQTAYNTCKDGHKVLYMSFEESEDSLLKHMHDFGWDASKMVEQGLLRIKRFSAIDIARSVEALLSEAKKELLIATEPILFPKDFDPDIILIDSLTSIASAFSGEEYRFRIYMEQLFRYLENKGISSYLIKETPVPTHVGNRFSDSHGAISFLADGIICIYNVFYPGKKRGNGLEVLKMRGESFKKAIVKTEIKPKGGLFVYPNKELKGNFILT